MKWCAFAFFKGPKNLGVLARETGRTRLLAKAQRRKVVAILPKEKVPELTGME